ncbi:septal ring lytic transglycosylase RlpA family protein [Neolewinella sp.]|uniref:septal ring lytic transglycosylase RlpA family protein n=1 Tax=Neolewinella sp. TaxID=2993543 RepID=UPI003B519782
MLSPLRRLCVLATLLLLALPTLAQRTEGLASYYADRLHDQPTSTGEIYDKTDFTAASKDYPYNTVLEVTNVVSGARVKVRVNDCGPYHPDRIIDLSRAAARKVGVLRSGTAKVQLRVVKMGEGGPACERSAWAEEERAQNAADVGTEVVTTEPEPQAAVPVPLQPTEPETPPTVASPAAPSVPVANGTAPANVGVDVVAKGGQTRRNFAPDEMLFGVQVGAFGKEDNATQLAAQLEALGFSDVWTAQVGQVYRVFTGRYYFQDEAESLKLRVREAGYRDASVRRVQ